MEKTIVEYKIKEEGVKWENIKVSLTDPESPDAPQSIDTTAVFLARCYHAEVRWNYEGSAQGHYVGWWY